MRDLLNTPFNELSATPGIGQKKICSFVKLLARAANTDPSELPSDVANLREMAGTVGNGHTGNGNGFDPSNVSEVVWSQWRATVVKHDLGSQTLGTPRTQPPAHDARDLECAAERLHGSHAGRDPLDEDARRQTRSRHSGGFPQRPTRWWPKWERRNTWWCESCPDRSTRSNSGQARPCKPLACQARRRSSTTSSGPLLEQVRNDATQQIATLAENRLGISGPITSVRQAARNMGLTRARVYQLLNEINDIMIVRWPMGRHQVYELRDKFEAEAGRDEEPPRLEAVLRRRRSLLSSAIGAERPAGWNKQHTRATPVKGAQGCRKGANPAKVPSRPRRPMRRMRPRKTHELVTAG